MKRKINSMLALLIMGSASLMAQTADPFPVVNYGAYPNNMTIFGHVRIDGQVQPDGTIVAVYCGDEIRGKDVVQSNAFADYFFMFNVIGESKEGMVFPLHFKVFTGGRIIEVDQGLTYSDNATVGNPNNPYYIDLPAPVVTTPSTEGWATTCLPFNAEIPEGVIAYAATGIEDGELLTQQLQGTILPANVPALLKSTDLENYEWLSRVATADAPATNILVGTTEDITVEANSVLTLGHSNETGEIGFWCYTGTTISANRAYITDFPGIRGVKIKTEGDDTTGITELDNLTISPFDNSSDNGPMVQCYDLQGRRLERSTFNVQRSTSNVQRSTSNVQRSTLKKGVYVINGRKVIIR